jgi:ANTAR domain
MERYRLTVNQAFRLLAQASHATNRKLRDIARGAHQTGARPV